VRDDEQSVMKSGNLCYSKHEAQRRQTLGHQWRYWHQQCSRADEDDVRSRRRDVKWLQQDCSRSRSFWKAR